MKKALIAALCFIVVSILLVNGTFALPTAAEISQWFQTITSDLFGSNPFPEADAERVTVKVHSQVSGALYPGVSAVSESWVTNEGGNDVYFRLVYAIQYDAASWHKLHLDFACPASYAASLTPEGEYAWIDTTIGGVPYKAMVFSYTGALSGRAQAPQVALTIYMDPTMTNDDISRYNADFLQVQAFAIGAAPFTPEKGYATAIDALDAALPLDRIYLD